jgi:hypothetical protein
MTNTKPSFLYLMFLSMTVALLAFVPIARNGYSQTSGNGISILSSSSFTDNLGYYHVVGEVKTTHLPIQ